jgi:hypothetical protein
MDYHNATLVLLQLHGSQEKMETKENSDAM